MTDSDSYLSQLFGLAQSFATPFAQKLANDTLGTKSAEQTANANLQETVINSQLNGSGPANPALAAQQAPTSMFDFINGVNRTAPATPQGNGMMTVVILLGVGAIAFILFRKR